MKSISKVIFLYLFIVTTGCPWLTQSGHADPVPVPQIAFAPRHYICYHTGGELTIDGKLAETDWQNAAWSEDFVDIEGSLKPAPWFRTRMKMLWDDKNLYIAADLQETDVWATLKKRDSIIFIDNDFEVFIDPDGDTHHYYELEVNAFGTEWDLFLNKPYRDGAKAMFYWDIDSLQTRINVQGTINQPGDKDYGWTVELAIPWKVLQEFAAKPGSPEHGEQWRMNFSRVEWRTDAVNGKYIKIVNPATGKPYPEENWVWSPQGIINMHYPELWGFVQFSTIPVGSGRNEFIAQPQEQVKWALRQVYYAQKAFYQKNGKYSNNYQDFHLDIESVAGYHWPPVMQTTDHYFEAQSQAIDGNDCWIIQNDSKIYQIMRSSDK
ncbi:MAG TPA: carbohydrate-binding family 9-like protein [bacterium]|nr:carbohydrate-binding family 9-like protein [bacterium]HPN43524.1 carbohydrate-binding family 9-like protein [bacterium]